MSNRFLFPQPGDQTQITGLPPLPEGIALGLDCCAVTLADGRKQVRMVIRQRLEDGDVSHQEVVAPDAAACDSLIAALVNAREDAWGPI